MKLLKYLFYFTIIYIYLPAFLCQADSNSRQKAIIIPVLIPLTGNSAEQGEWIRQGVKLAEEELNAKSKIEVKAIFEDTQADPKNAISAYRSLRNHHTFSSVITYGSGVGLALSPISNRDQVIQMGVATASPAYRSMDDYSFRNFPSADIDAEFLVKSILEKFNAKEIATINVQNEYGVASKNALKNLFIAAGGKIIFEEELEPNGTDYRSIILRLKEKNPKVAYLAVYSERSMNFRIINYVR